MSEGWEWKKRTGGLLIRFDSECPGTRKKGKYVRVEIVKNKGRRMVREGRNWKTGCWGLLSHFIWG